MDDELDCHECSRPMVVSDDGVSHHWDLEGDCVDYESDADHVAFSLDAESPLP